MPFDKIKDVKMGVLRPGTEPVTLNDIGTELLGVHIAKTFSYRADRWHGLFPFMKTPEFQSILHLVSFIGGGSVRDTLLGDTIRNDIDIYFNSQRNYEQAIYTWKMFNDITVERKGKIAVNFRVRGRKIQFIQMKSIRPDRFFNFVDLTVSQVAITFDFHRAPTLVYTNKALEHIREKKLELHRIRYPVSMLQRIQKYKGYGFSIDEEEVKLFFHVLEQYPDLINNIMEYYHE